MRYWPFIITFVLAPCMAWSQNGEPSTTHHQPCDPLCALCLCGEPSSSLNPTTLAVVLANKPERFTQEEWLQMMEKPVSRSLHPLRVTQAMLDTLDARQLDLRFQYQMVPEH